MTNNPRVSDPSRRTFLKASAATLTLSQLFSSLSFGSTGANDRIRVACVGLNKKGRSHIREFLSLGPKGVELVALCDVDDHVLEERAGELEKETGHRPQTFRDIRKLLEDPSIDAISIATPNHWHALMTIWACQAGKDVYVEKPASWCIREGQKMVEAARKYQRIVQVGTQARSFSHVRQAIQGMQQGLIGDLYMARGLCYKQRESIGFKEPQAPPSYLDFDLWLGPAKKQAYHENLVHYNWHWFWEFGNGDIGNQGIHELDLARWAFQKEGLIRVTSTGGRFGYRDQGETPNTQSTTIVYPDGSQIVFEVRGRYTNAEEGIQIGNLFYGTEGYLPGANWGEGQSGYVDQDQSIADWNPKFGFSGQPYRGQKVDSPFQLHEGKLDEDYIHHFENFIEAIRKRDHAHLNADILEGHRSAMLAHSANISYRLGMPLTFDTNLEKFVGDGAKEANHYLTREYRAPFVVPDEV